MAQNLTMFDLLRPRFGALRTFIEVCKDKELFLDIIKDIYEDPELQKTPTSSETILYRFTSLLYKFIATTYMRWSLSYIYEESVATNINIADHWVNLKLSKRAAHRVKEETTDIIDSEHIAFKLSEGVIVVVKGEPGMGKSTLVRKLCYDWMFLAAQEGESQPSEMAKHLRNYSLLLPVELRSAEKCETLIELSLTYLLPRLHLNLAESQFKQLLNEVSAKAARNEVLMILDGFDEQEGKCAQLQRILTNDLYMAPCPLLITTRPEMLSQIDAAIEIVNVCGLKYNEQVNYIEVYCKNPRAKQRMKELLEDEKNEAIQKPAKVPFFLSILCYMAEEQADEGKVNVLPLPAQLGNVFNNFLCLTHQRLKKKFPTIKELTMKQLAPLGPVWNEGFRFMGELAFEAFKNDKKIFSQAEFEEHSITRELCLNMEFLTTGMHKSLIFLHDTFQEFFACYHLHDTHFKEYNEQIRKDMYSLKSDDRKDIRKKVAETLQELYNFRKIFSNRQNCMQQFLAFFDSVNHYNAVKLWNKLNDNGQYVNEMNSNVLKWIKAADHFDKFKERLHRHYNNNVLEKTIKPNQLVPLKYRVKREKLSDEMESTSFYELAQSLIHRPIMLYGNTLVGKTTTLASIVVQWCFKKFPWEKYDIILFIPLSRLHNNCNDVFDLCLQYLLPKLDMETGNDYLHESLKQHLCDLGKEHRLLLLFDDLHLFKASCQEMTELLSDCDGKKLLPADMIISTSLNSVSDLTLDTVGLLHVKGFTEFQQVEHYIELHKCLSGLTFKQEDQLDECFHLPGLLKISCELPELSKTDTNPPTDINLAIIQIWNEYINRSKPKFQTNNNWYKHQLGLQGLQNIYGMKRNVTLQAMNLIASLALMKIFYNNVLMLVGL